MKFSKIFLGLAILSSLALGTAAFAGNNQHNGMHNSGQAGMMYKNCPNMNADGTMKNGDMHRSETKRQHMNGHRGEHRSNGLHGLIEGRSN